MTPERPALQRTLNLWDMLIGFCYGIQITCLILRLIGRVGADVFIWGQLVFLFGLALQSVRLWNSRFRDTATSPNRKLDQA